MVPCLKCACLFCRGCAGQHVLRHDWFCRLGPELRSFFCCSNQGGVKGALNGKASENARARFSGVIDKVPCANGRASPLCRGLTKAPSAVILHISSGKLRGPRQTSALNVLYWPNQSDVIVPVRIVAAQRAGDGIHGDAKGRQPEAGHRHVGGLRAGRQRRPGARLGLESDADCRLLGDSSCGLLGLNDRSA